jgi:hypothetical protein
MGGRHYLVQDIRYRYRRDGPAQDTLTQNPAFVVLEVYIIKIDHMLIGYNLAR